MKFDVPLGTYSGSSAFSVINTVPLPPLGTRSRPWSKNWPNNVNHESYGADTPKSGVEFGSSNSCNGEPVTGLVAVIVLDAGLAVAAATAAGLALVWSATRLLARRADGSTTVPVGAW